MGVVTVPGPEPTETNAPFGPRGGRVVVWPIKQSLLDYVDAMDGTATGRRGPEGFVFDGDCDGAQTLSCMGTVQLTAHGGRLDILMSDLRIVHDGTAGQLSAVVSAAPNADRIEIARLGPLQDEGDALVLEDVALTHAGSALFQGNYAPHTRLDPLRVRRPAPGASD